MATSKIKTSVDKYIIKITRTGSYSNLGRNYAVVYDYSTLVPDGYDLLQPIVVKTPNDNWVTGYATKQQTGTNLAINGQNLHTGAISGAFTLLLIFEYVGGVVSRLLKALQSLSFKLERRCA